MLKQEFFKQIYSGKTGSQFLTLLHTDERSNAQEHNILDGENKSNQSNKRMFKHLLLEKEESSIPIRTTPCPKILDFVPEVAPDIPETDYEDEKDNKCSY